MNLKLIKYIQEKTKTELPGKAAQLIMSPSDRNTSNRSYPINSAKNSSVLILLYPKNGSIYIPFTLRAQYKGAHSGQISLPGGKVEETDRDLEHTALRETYEEIGIHSNSITTIGSLTPTYIPNSNFNVYPFIAYCSEEPEFKPDNYEVDEIIEAPLHQIMNPNSVKQFEKNINGHDITAPYFDINKHRIWGATAMIISELKQLLLHYEEELIH
ncbi:NUDIX hydrolase [Saccharicrinis aurantiacus]|uniref:NUDIX hydrolase n=1 Tax=Saccharicrinis aurantiacus TaxID=1849719 RepID=UPI0024933FF7|nr:CoA pyrophosphatase [Saccharicrinis aurantiacus]